MWSDIIKHIWLQETILYHQKKKKDCIFFFFPEKKKRKNQAQQTILSLQEAILICLH